MFWKLPQESEENTEDYNDQKEEEDGKSFYNVVDKVSIESLRKMSQRIIRHFVEVIFLVMILERKPV